MGDMNIEGLLKYDFSIGTQRFRDSLLERCISVIEAHSSSTVLDDSTLSLLSAAGDPNLAAPREFPIDNPQM